MLAGHIKKEVIMAQHNIGSIWRKWDLHVHTPASVFNRYGSESEEVWERFISDLEDLPADFSVIGVNDYLFLDGYKKLLDYKKAGRIQNIETLFPVVEFRLSKFAGHEKMLRVNFHVIFSEQLEPDVIEAQFLSQLKGQLNITAEHASLKKQWNAVITKTSLQELGRLIKDSIPEARAHEFNESDFLLGFNNVNFYDTNLLELLDKSSIRGKFLTAIGKAEWDQYRWNDNSIAEKKNIINSVDIVFTAAEDIPSFLRGRDRLSQEGVNNHLFDCSDSHSFSDTDDKDRIGYCHTWVIGDTTLNGLLLAIKDYDDLVYVGNRPALLDDIDRNPSKYIKHVAIARRSGYSPNGKWFDNVELPINPELIAVIGNRGMGKSALLDAISLAGNSTQPISELSFLNPFQAARGKLAESFEVDLEFYSSENRGPVPLSTHFDPSIPTLVKHLPQHFIDVICNEENDQFEIEIERVVFSHVPEEERLRCNTLSELIEYRSEALNQAIEDQRNEISVLNEKIATLEKETSQRNIAHLKNILSQRLGDLHEMWQKRPTIPPTPESSSPELDKKIKGLRENIDTLNTQKLNSEKRINELRGNIEAARRISALLDKLEKDNSRYSSEYSEDFSKLGLSYNKIVSLELDRSAVSDREKEFTEELNRLRDDLNEEVPNSLASKLVATRSQLEEAEATLSAPLQVYQAARKTHIEYKDAIHQLIGDTETPDTIRFLKSKIAHIEEDAPAQLSSLEESRNEKSEELFALLQKHIDLLKELYAPVQGFVDKHPPTDTDFRVSFNATLEAVEFVEQFSTYIAFNKRGTYYGTEQAHTRILDLLRDVNFNEWESVSAFINVVNESLHYDKRPDANNDVRLVEEQLRPDFIVADLYDYIFGLKYIAYRHNLTMGGRPLFQLSPGEKGALLLAFYLLVDQNDCPLLIDQPEENLDNQSVYKVLVPFIREARRRRQVILVTHNPNIAVVAAAEQVIYCEMNKACGYRLNYISGALENPVMNQYVLDVLEGTRPAFSSRDMTYDVSADNV